MLKSLLECAPAGGKGYTFATWLRLEALDSDGARSGSPKSGAASGGRALYTLLWRSPNEAGAKGVAAALKGAPQRP